MGVSSELNDTCASYASISLLVEFDNYMQQDAHEFLNFLINHINETIIGKVPIRITGASVFPVS